MSTALDRVDAGAIARDVSRVVRVPSITGTERAMAAEIVALRGADAAAPRLALNGHTSASCAGRWSSQVPEELTCERRLGGPVGKSLGARVID